MSLIIDSKRAGYGDDMQRVTTKVIDSMTIMTQMFVDAEAIKTAIIADPDMTQTEIDEMQALIDSGYQYIWSNVKNIVPVGFQV
jgi:hypothetical protein